MLEQASAKARPTAIPALLAKQGETAQESNMGEAFVSLFHQLMSKGKVAAPNNLGLDLFGKRQEIELPPEPAPVQQKAAPKQETVKEQKDTAPKQEAVKDTKDDDSNKEVAAKDEHSEGNTEEKDVASKEQVQATQGAEGAIAATTQVASKEQVAQTVEAQPEAVAETTLLHDMAPKQTGPKKVEVQQQHTKQQATEEQSLITDSVNAAQEVVSGPENGAQKAVATTEGKAAKKEGAIILPQESSLTAGKSASHFDNEFAHSDLLMPKVAPQVAPTPAVSQAAPTQKAADVLQSALRDWAKGSVLGVGGVDRRNEMNPNVNSSGLADKKIPVLKETPNSSGKNLKSQQVKMLEQIQQLMEKAAQTKDGNSLVLKLDPVELGQVTVKVTQRADQVFARVSAENDDVERFLRENMGEVMSSLAAAGIKGDNVHVSIGREISEAEQLFVRSQGQADVNGGSGKQQGKANYRGGKFEAPAPETLPEQGGESGLDSGWVA